jgi:glycosyltransferase involved in cell wall biosynthesis
MNHLTKIPVSVIIPAKNEESNLPACLESLSRADEIFVVDSQSTDRSIAIAEEFGAQVVQFEFNGRWPKKKNWSLENLPFRNPWVLIVDCDERITDALWDEIAEKIQSEQHQGYYLNRRIYFLGQWLRHGGKYPDWNLRLFQHQLGRYENLNTENIQNTGDNEVHEHVVLTGTVGYLKEDMLHIDFRDMFQWIARHNRYSNWEAQVYLNTLTGKGEGGTMTAGRSETIGGSLLGNAVQRKRFLKKIWVTLPFKPLLRFILVYFIRFGFLDGKAGYIYARLISQYEYQIGVKLFELKHFSGAFNSKQAKPPAEPIASLPLNVVPQTES